MSDSKKSVIDRLYECIEADGYDSLAEDEKSMFALYWLFMEGNNGGLHQFFFNDSGKFAHQALKGLEVVGAAQTADILRRAVAAFPNGQIPDDLEERRTLLDELEEADEDFVQRFRELNSEFFKCQEDVAEMLNAYRSGHPELFPCLEKN